MFQRLVRSKSMAVLVIAAAVAGFLLMGMSFGASAQDDRYEFPVVPGSEAWGELRTHAEMLAVTQVPEGVLSKMSTTGLVSTILDYPMFGDYLMFNTLQEGYKAVARFNGIQNLSERRDGADELAQRYGELDLNNMLRTDRMPAMRVGYTELLLAQDTTLAQLGTEGRSRLLDDIVAQGEVKARHPGRFSPEETVFLTGRILLLDNAEFQRIVAGEPRLQAFFAEGAVQAFTAEEVDQLLVIMLDLIANSK